MCRTPWGNRQPTSLNQNLATVTCQVDIDITRASPINTETITTNSNAIMIFAGYPSGFRVSWPSTRAAKISMSPSSFERKRVRRKKVDTWCSQTEWCPRSRIQLPLSREYTLSVWVLGCDGFARQDAKKCTRVSIQHVGSFSISVLKKSRTLCRRLPYTRR